MLGWLDANAQSAEQNLLGLVDVVNGFSHSEQKTNKIKDIYLFKTDLKFKDLLHTKIGHIPLGLFLVDTELSGADIVPCLKYLTGKMSKIESSSYCMHYCTSLVHTPLEIVIINKEGLNHSVT